MAVLGLVLGIVALVLSWLMFRRRRAAQTRGPQAGHGPGGHEAESAASRHNTALEQLRDLRDALKPAEHTRIERRRAGGVGPYIGPERRRTAAPSLRSQRLHGLPDEIPTAQRRPK